MNSTFKLTDLGELKYSLDVLFERKTTKMFSKQSTYRRRVLEQFGMDLAKSAPTSMVEDLDSIVQKVVAGKKKLPESTKVSKRVVVRGLIYLRTQNRPEFSCSVGILSRLVTRSFVLFWIITERVLHYLLGTILSGIIIGNVSNDDVKHTEVDSGLESYTDSDWAGEIQSRKCTAGYTVTLIGGLICWRSFKQRSLAVFRTNQYIYTSLNVYRRSAIVVASKRSGRSRQIQLSCMKRTSLESCEPPKTEGVTSKLR